MTVPMKQPAATSGDIMESVLLKGDLAKLQPEERVRYYNEVCKSVGLNPLTQPFAYITLNGKLQLYALRACTDQLRKVNGVSLEIVSKEAADDILTVHVRAKLPDGRFDEDLGAVAFPPTLKGEARANAELKCITKAKRRATLSICGLGWLDETEVEDIPAAAKRPSRPAPNVMLATAAEPHDPETGELSPQQPQPAWEQYVDKWHGWIDTASSRAHADQYAKQWNDEKKLRNTILWPDDDTFEKLQKKVKGAIKMLREHGAEPVDAELGNGGMSDE